jgi:hypothetical protein
MKKLHLLLLLFLTTTLAGAQISKLISYQGMLSTLAGTVPQGDYQLTFRLYGDSKNSAPIWTETQTISVLPGGTFSMNVSQSPATTTASTKQKENPTTC